MWLLFLILILLVASSPKYGVQAVCLTTAGDTPTSFISKTDSTQADAAFVLACAEYKLCGDLKNSYGPVAKWDVDKVTIFDDFASRCVGTATSPSPPASFNPVVINVFDHLILTGRNGNDEPFHDCGNVAA